MEARVMLWELIKDSQDSITVNKHVMSTNFNKNSDVQIFWALWDSCRVRKELKLKGIYE